MFKYNTYIAMLTVSVAATHVPDLYEAPPSLFSMRATIGCFSELAKCDWTSAPCGRIRM